MTPEPVAMPTAAPAGVAEPPAHGRAAAFGPAVILLGTLLVFLPVASFAFVWDDQLLILRSAATADLASLWRGLRTDLWSTTPAPIPQPYWRPLVVIDWFVDRQLFGLSPMAHHLHSLAWHLVAVALLLRIVRGYGTAGLVGAALFALHPVQVEAVAFVAARNDLMAGAFALGALLGAMHARLVPVALLAACAMASKELAIVLPVVIALWLWATERPWPRATAAAAVGIGGVVAARLALGVGAAHGVSPGAVWEATPQVSAMFAQKLALPYGLVSSWHVAHPGPLVWACLPVVLLAAVGLGLRGRRGLAGVAIAALLVAPSLVGVVDSGLVADRYLYAPMIGLALACTALPAVPVAGVVAVLLGLGALTSVQLRTWVTSDALWAHATRVAPSPYAWGAWGKDLEESGRLDEAAIAFRNATQAPTPFPHACFNVTSIHLKRRDAAAAIAEGERALAAGCDPSPELLGPLSLAYALRGAWERAEEVAAGVDPDPTGQAKLVRIAARLRRGDLGPLQEVAPDQHEALLSRVLGLLEASGDVAGAAALREQITPK